MDVKDLSCDSRDQNFGDIFSVEEQRRYLESGDVTFCSSDENRENKTKIKQSNTSFRSTETLKRQNNSIR